MNIAGGRVCGIGTGLRFQRLANLIGYVYEVIRKLCPLPAAFRSYRRRFSTVLTPGPKVPGGGTIPLGKPAPRTFPGAKENAASFVLG
jgi:hypothetical protein